VLTTIAAILLIVVGVTNGFYVSYTLAFLTVACTISEWRSIRLPRGNLLTLSIIPILLAIVLDFEQPSDWQRVIGAMQVIAVGSLLGYGLLRRLPPLHVAFYTAHHILSALLAGWTYVLVSRDVPRWLISSFHLPAVVAYTAVYSLFSLLMINPFNASILKGEKLPKADPLYTFLLAPIALIVYHFFVSRQLGVGSLLVLLLPLVGVLITLGLYVNIDTTHNEIQQLYRISRGFVAAMSRGQTVQRVGESIAQAISELIPRVDACLVYTHNDASHEYLLVHQSDGSSAPAVVIPGRGLLGQAVNDHTGTVLNDVTHANNLSPGERGWTARTALLAHPLIAEQNPVGLVALLRRGRGFTAEEFRLVSIVANQAGATLHNALMFERSRELADKDRLLDVLNQTAFTQNAQRILSRARLENQVVALLYPDIDDFRILNNTYGHSTGDRVLSGVAQVMKEVMASRGIIGRSGGEEFFILLPDTSEQEAMDTANEIRQRIRDSVFTSDDGHQVQTTISTGVAIFPRDAGDFANLRKRADRASYLAKRTGKDRVCLYQDRKELIESIDQEPERVAPRPFGQEQAP
jgi:diguanylate cyclase (GGDEF)-like protein